MYMEHKLDQNHIACQIARGAAWNTSGSYSSKHMCDLRRKYSDLSEGNDQEKSDFCYLPSEVHPLGLTAAQQL